MTISRMQEPRQLYGLGSLVKSIGKAAKKVVKSPLGKAAILGAGIYGLGGGFGLKPGGFAFGNLPGASFFGKGSMNPLKAMISSEGWEGLGPSKFANLLSSKAGKFGIGGALAAYLASQGMEEEQIAEIQQDGSKVEPYLRDLFKKLNPNLPDGQIEEMVQVNLSEYKADGGRVGLKDGTPEKKKGIKSLIEKLGENALYKISEFVYNDPSMVTALEKAGYMPYDTLSEDKKKYIEAFKRDDKDWLYTKPGKISFPVDDRMKAHNAKWFEKKFEKVPRRPRADGSMPTGILRTNDAGTVERDYRDQGGFVPVGIKEKADDVPAMLSKNEFVMTADAVRGIGGGDVEKGAQKLYNTMKQAERRVV